MPLVHVHLRAGRPAAAKQAILDGVHAASDVAIGFELDV